MAKKMMMEQPVTVPAPLEVDCIPCLENMGLWLFAARLRAGERVWQYEVDAALAEAGHSHEAYPHGHSPFPGAIGPIRDSVGVDSLNSMMSEGCPPNTGRRYEEV